MGDFYQGSMGIRHGLMEPLRFTGWSLQWCSSGLYGTLDRQREKDEGLRLSLFLGG